MDKKSGRPRKYETAAEKVDAFRQRLQSAGYLRKEVLVTQSTWEQVQALAKAQGVGVVDVASGLLEYGLSHYATSQAQAQAQAQTRAESPSSVPLSSAQRLASPCASGSLMRAASTGNTVSVVSGVSAALDPGEAFLASEAMTASSVEGNPPVNPILNFFARRKEQL